jgi:retron-type reverse transcriptase
MAPVGLGRAVPQHAIAVREWVIDVDISACFDEIDHRALMGSVCARI